jgi:hypothetical protein
MREAGAPSTEEVATHLCGVVPDHRGLSYSHHPRSCATLRGRKAKGRSPVPWEVWELRPANGDGQDRAHALG